MTAEPPRAPSRLPDFLSAAWEQTGPFDPERSYLIAALPRSGSTLLSGALETTGRLGKPMEYFNGGVLGHAALRLGVPTPTLRARWHRFNRRRAGSTNWSAVTALRPRSVGDYVERLYHVRSTANGVFGVKLHWGQVLRMRTDAGVDLLDVLAPRRVVLLTRRDRLRQAISYYRARQTQVWVARPGTTPRVAEVAFDADEIQATAGRLAADEAAWREELARRGLPVHEIVYEDLDADYDAQLQACFGFLGEADLPVPRRPFERLADQETEEWVARLRPIA